MKTLDLCISLLFIGASSDEKPPESTEPKKEEAPKESEKLDIAADTEGASRTESPTAKTALGKKLSELNKIF
jgi:hypothetical protein